MVNGRHITALFASALIAVACSAPTQERAAEPTPASTTSPPRPTPTPRATPTAASSTDPFALARRFEASDAASLARSLTQAENAIRSDDTDPDGIAEHARVQQAAYRQLVRTPKWRDEVVARLPDGLRPVARANVEAGSDLRRLTQPRTELPPWRIVAPPPADELRSHYTAGEKEFGIDWTYLAAIHLVETRMGRIRGTSIAGAKGPMQFLPSTWERWGKGDVNDARDAILAAARYLRGHGAPADMDRALFAYNHSDLYVNAIKLYASQMRDATRAYDAYYHWDVYYRTTKGDALLYVGWPDK